jgi:hypothetical protein
MSLARPVCRPRNNRYSCAAIVIAAHQRLWRRNNRCRGGKTVIVVQQPSWRRNNLYGGATTVMAAQQPLWRCNNRYCCGTHTYAQPRTHTYAHKTSLQGKQDHATRKLVIYVHTHKHNKKYTYRHTHDWYLCLRQDDLARRLVAGSNGVAQNRDATHNLLIHTLVSELKRQVNQA